MGKAAGPQSGRRAARPRPTANQHHRVQLTNRTARSAAAKLVVDATVRPGSVVGIGTGEVGWGGVGPRWASLGGGALPTSSTWCSQWLPW